MSYIEGDKTEFEHRAVWHRLNWVDTFRFQKILFSNLWIYFLDSHIYWIRKSQSLFIDIWLDLSMTLQHCWLLPDLPFSDVSVITKMIFISKNSTFHCRHTVKCSDLVTYQQPKLKTSKKVIPVHPSPCSQHI